MIYFKFFKFYNFIWCYFFLFLIHGIYFFQIFLFNISNWLLNSTWNLQLNKHVRPQEESTSNRKIFECIFYRENKIMADSLFSHFSSKTSLFFTKQTYCVTTLSSTHIHKLMFKSKLMRIYFAFVKRNT